MPFPRPRYSLRAPAKALGWVLDLAQADPAAARQIATQLGTWIREAVDALETVRIGASVRPRLSPADLRALRAALIRLWSDPIFRGSGRVPAPEPLDGLTMRLAGWTRPSVEPVARALRLGLRRRPRLGPARALIEVAGPTPTVVLYLTFRLLEHVGLDRVRRCTACPRLFVFQRAGRTTCSTRCYLRVYMREYRRAGYRGTRRARRATRRTR